MQQIHQGVTGGTTAAPEAAGETAAEGSATAERRCCPAEGGAAAAEVDCCRRSRNSRRNGCSRSRSRRTCNTNSISIILLTIANIDVAGLLYNNATDYGMGEICIKHVGWNRRLLHRNGRSRNKIKNAL